MTTPRLARTDIDALSEEDAERLLRNMVRAANLKPGDESAASPETRQALLEGLERLDLPVDSKPGPTKGARPGPIRQALRVLAEDPAYGQLVTDAPNSRGASVQSPRDFGVDPIAFIGTTSLALLVLSTYVDLKRDADGRWTFHLRIGPQSDKLKAQIIALAKSLISALPLD